MSAAGIARLVLLAVVVVGLSWTRPPRADAVVRTVLPAAELVRLLDSGPVAFTGLQVGGPLDLQRRVRFSFSCRGCTIYGGVRARATEFESTVDLSGSIIRGRADFEQARFHGQALFGSPPAASNNGTVFSQEADFRLARFDQLTTFEWAKFSHGADFTLASFAGDAIFSHVTLNDSTDRTRKHEQGRGRPLNPAVFVRTLFRGRADFLHAGFATGADFTLASFGGDAEFSQAIFALQSAIFSDVQFAGNADFRGASFVGTSGTLPYSADFDRADAAGDLDFDGATFAPMAPAAFERTTAQGVLSFTAATLPTRPEFDMKDVAAGQFKIAVPDLLRAVNPENQRQMLALLETTAQAHNDLALANDALYAKRVLISRGYPLPERLLDLVFYRWIAGYLVRPIRPLVALALLALLLTTVELAASRRPKQEASRLLRLRRAGSSYLHGYLDTLTLIGRKKPDSDGRRLEILAYRVLLVCAVVGIANSNPTLRQMIDALH